MEKKRPQLNLTELYQLKWIIGGLLAMLSASTVLYMEVDAWVWLVLITAATPVVMRWPVLTLHIPRWVHRLTFPAIVALLAADYYINREPLPALIRLSLMLVFYRAVTSRKRRDDLQLIVLGLFLVVVAGVLSVSLAFAVQIVAFTGCALLFLMLINLIDAAEIGQAPTELSVRTPPTWMNMEFKRLARRLHESTDWRIAVLGSGLFVGVVGLSALVFFALPRFEIANNFFLDDLITRKSKSGFSENIQFGDVTDIQQDTSVALRVEVSDPAAIPANPYWRMLVLDVYKNGGFSMSDQLGEHMRRQLSKSARIAGSAKRRAGDAVWTFYLEGGTARYLPLLGSFQQLRFNDGEQDYAINDELRMLRIERQPVKMFAYQVSGMRFTDALGPIEFAAPRRAQPIPRAKPDADGSRERPPGPMPDFLGLNFDETDLAKVTAWAKALDKSPGDAQAFAGAARDWLWGRHSYSLQSTIPSGTGDPLVRWMDSTVPGHCELFSGAFTVLARAAGYPARVVTGFHGGTWNAGSNHLSIRNSDAHAWCEIQDAARRWVRVDPTPSAIRSEQAGPADAGGNVMKRPQARSWDARLDGLRMFWYRSIVDFDRSSQKELAKDAKTAVQELGKRLTERINAQLKVIRDWLRQPWDGSRLVAWVGVIVAFGACAAAWRLFGRITWQRWRSGRARRGADPVRREAGRWLRQLELRGGADDAERQAVRAELERLRYGARGGWPNPQPVFRRAKRACAQRTQKRPRG